MVIPSAQEPPPSAKMSNGYPRSPVTVDAPAESDVVPKSEATPSEPIDSHAVSESSPNPILQTSHLMAHLQCQMEKTMMQ